MANKNRNRQNQNQSRNRQPQALTCTWEFGKTTLVPGVRRLPVWLTFKRGQQSATGVVTLQANGDPVAYPSATPSILADGKVFFAVSLRVDETECDLIAQVGNVSLVNNWKLPEPKLTVTVSEGPGFKILVVDYSAEDVLFPAKFEVWPTTGCQIAVREVGITAWITRPGMISFPSTGRAVYHVKTEQLVPGAGGEHIFVSVEGKTFRSDLIYISRHQ